MMKSNQRTHIGKIRDNDRGSRWLENRVNENRRIKDNEINKNKVSNYDRVNRAASF